MPKGGDKKNYLQTTSHFELTDRCSLSLTHFTPFQHTHSCPAKNMPQIKLDDIPTSDLPWGGE